MDPIFYVEMGIVGLAVLAQVIIFFRNAQSVARLRKLIPPAAQLKTQTVAAVENDASIELIEDQRSFGETFREILHTTNAYLTKNQGAADFDILKDMADRKVYAQERAIEANIALPLYIGLLCTFTGVIIGLVKIALVGVSDAAIQSFIGGVLIGMIGSASGLALTVRSNYIFRDGKKIADRNAYDYITFLRTYILPALRRESHTPVSTLRENLSAFNESFTRYQTYVNDSLGESLRLFNDLKAVFTQLRSVEQSVSNLGNLLRANDGLIDKQAAYIESYAQRAEALNRKLGEQYRLMGQQVETMIGENVQSLERSTQAAYLKMDQYLATLGAGDRQAGAQAMTQDLQKMRGEVAAIQQQTADLNQRLLQELNNDRGSRTELTQELKTLSARLDKLAASGNFVNSVGYRIFAFAGTLAFLAGIAAAALYFFNYFTA